MQDVSQEHFSFPRAAAAARALYPPLPHNSCPADDEHGFPLISVFWGSQKHVLLFFNDAMGMNGWGKLE